MSLTLTQVTRLILDQLALKEMRLLVLTVAVRRKLDQTEGIKGNLGQTIKLALNKLIAAKMVKDVEGVYVLLGKAVAG